MTPTERAVAVLNRWCGTDGADQLDEKPKDLWNRTKAIGKPSHSAIPFYQQAAEDLVNRLIAEFKKPDPHRVNISLGNLNPSGGTIVSLDDLLNAVARFRRVKPLTVAVTLTAQAHEALVQSIVTQITPKLAAPRYFPHR